jgi:hypothetical protein
MKRTFDDRLWKEGSVEIKVNGEKKTAMYWAKVYDEGSVYGIDEGRISKLQIKIDGVTVACYDRGWDLELDKNDEAAMIAYNTIIKKYN